jgi:hypothetical protein
MKKDKLTPDEKLQIVELSKKYTIISNNIQNFSKELKAVQDKINEETDILTRTREEEKIFMEQIQEKYGFTLEAIEVHEIINEWMDEQINKK